MKRLIFITLFALLTVAVCAQRGFNVAVSDSVKTGDLTYTYVIDYDDLSTTDYYYSSHVEMDSVSGTQAAYAYLQFSNQESGDYWYTADTVSCTSASGASSFNTGTLQAVRVRLYVVTSGTTRTDFAWGFHAVPRK